VAPALDALADQRVAAVEEDDAAVGQAAAEHGAAGFLQRRAGEHCTRTARLARTQFRVQAHEPGPAVLVRERRAGGHLGGVRGRMPVVAVDELAAEPRREQRSDGRLAGAGDAHHQHDHRAAGTAWPPKRARIMARSFLA